MNKLRLTRKLVLESPQAASDGAGGLVETWVSLGTLWADVQGRSGRDRLAGETFLGSVGYRITVRAAPEGSPARPRAGQRFREGSRVYQIEAVTERDAEARYLTCFANEEVAS